MSKTYLYPKYKKPYVLCKDKFPKSCRPRYNTPANHAGIPRHTMKIPGTPSRRAVQK